MTSAHQPQPIDQATPMLGGLTPQQFMSRHWHKKPLVVRQAFPGITPPLPRSELFALAGQEGIESRLITRHADGQWQLRHGPLPRQALPPLKQAAWTLLVQGLDLHVPAAHELLSKFRFVPAVRLDDLMISYATDGGGVGPHLDSYDVFLIQVHGKRRWRFGRVPDQSLVPDVPLKILQHFEPEEDVVLEPGDMLYLPPLWGHDGVAEGECMTCSVGFRAPSSGELARDLLLRVGDAIEPDDMPRRYRDPRQTATVNPGEIPAAFSEFAREALEAALHDPLLLACTLGEVLSEPKPQVWFEPGEPLPAGRGVRLDARTRLLYDAKHVFINGESFCAGGRDARLIRQLADTGALAASEVAKLSADAQELLGQWAVAGWVRAD